MTNYFKLGVLFILLSNLQGYSQSKEKEIYRYYDDNVTQINLPVFNGLFYQNDFYKHADNTFEFFKEKGYTLGSVLYDGEPYSNIKLKYDLVRQKLVAQSSESSGNIGVALLDNKIQSFEIYETTFFNLKMVTEKAVDEGFYKKIEINKDLYLYQLLKKTTVTKVEEKITIKKFALKVEDVMLEKGGEFFAYNSKADLISIFPNYSKEINLYYNSNNENGDPLQFKINLLKNLNI